MTKRSAFVPKGELYRQIDGLTKQNKEIDNDLGEVINENTIQREALRLLGVTASPTDAEEFQRQVIYVAYKLGQLERKK